MSNMSKWSITGFYVFCLTLVWGVGPAPADQHDVSGTDTEVSAGHDHQHDHAADVAVTVRDDARGGGFTLRRLTGWLGKFHPAAVHFPIALLLAALLAEVISILTGSQRYASAGRYCLVLGALSAVLAGTLGWFFGGFHLIDDGSWRSLETRHRWAGTVTALLSIGLLILCRLSARPDARVSKRLYRVTLVVTAGLVGFTGYLGAALVWGADHMAW